MREVTVRMDVNLDQFGDDGTGGRLVPEGGISPEDDAANHILDALAGLGVNIVIEGLD